MGIQHTAEFMNITRFVQQRELPVRPLPRKHDEIWHVRATPLNFADENHSPYDWTLVRRGDVVVIPLCSYETTGIDLEEPNDLAKLFTIAVDLGQRFGQRYSQAVRTHIIMGYPIEDLRPAADALRCWLGYAVRIA